MAELASSSVKFAVRYVNRLAGFMPARVGAAWRTIFVSRSRTAMPIARELGRCDGSSEMMGGKTPPIKMIRMQKATAFCKQLPTANK